MKRLRTDSALLWSWLAALAVIAGEQLLQLLALIPFVAGWLVGGALWLAALLAAAAVDGFEKGRRL